MRKPQICICDEGVLGDVVSPKRFPFRSRAARGSESSLLVDLEPGTTPACRVPRAPGRPWVSDPLVEVCP